MRGNEYPECEKLRSVAETSRTIGEFLDWLENEEEVVFSRRDEDHSELIGMHIPRERMLAKFFGIDLAKVEEERRAMLTEIRDAQLKQEATR